MAKRAPLVEPPQPVAVNSRPVVLVGTALWFVAFVVLLPFYSELGRHHHRIWLWTCLAGWILGLVASVVVGRHRRAGRTL